MPRRLAAIDLVGQRVRLRSHRREDAAAAFALIAARDEILRWLVWDGPSSPDELGEYYEHWAIEGDGGPDLRLAIEERASGEFAGSLAVRFAGHSGRGDVGYWIGLPFQRRGLGREALELCAHLAFQHLAASSLSALVFVGNEASRRVLERTGFTLARTAPGRILKRGVRVDEWHFVLLASDWRRLRPELRLEREEIAWVEVGPDEALESSPRPFPTG